ncbi:MAG: hypothetical protein KC493_17150 [Bacteriovoracaceae bacterium]|nr:hypothetical protein [Bacteriovoracaceae bacterium]
MKKVIVLLFLVSCAHYKKCDENQNPKELNQLAFLKVREDLQEEAISCYTKSCYKEDMEGCYQLATLIGYTDKKKSAELSTAVCQKGYKKACPSKFSNKKIYSRDITHGYSPNEKDTLRSWAQLLGGILERNVNRVGD